MGRKGPSNTFVIFTTAIRVKNKYIINRIVIRLMGKLYNLFKVKEFSEKKDFIKIKLSFSWFAWLFKVNKLSEIKKNNIKVEKNIIIKIKILLEKLNISLEAKEVT